MDPSNVHVIREMLDAFNRGDVEGVVAAFTEDCEIDEPAEMPDTPAEGHRGHDGVRRWMANLRDTAGVQFEARGFRGDGDVIVSKWMSSAVGRSSGAPAEWTTFVVLTMRGGRIARAQGFLSEDDALEDAGVRE